MPPETTASREEAARKELARADMKFLLSDPRGRRFLWKLIEDCEVFAVSTSPNNADKFLHDGKRVIGNTVIAQMMQAEPNSFHVMAAENSSSFKP